jgi:DNA modification methylase
VRNTIIQGDAFEVLRSLPAEHVQCVVTSTPYYGLRDYGVEGQIGLEETPAAYVAKLVEVFREVRRVLRSDGVAWVNLGDSYASSGKSGTISDTSNLSRHGAHGYNPKMDNQVFGRASTPPGMKSKNLLGIPWRVAFALQDDGWILRSDVIWHKTNAMPESVTDRPTSAHEHVFLLAKSERYYYDAEAIREGKQDRHYPTWEERKAAGEPIRRGDPGQSGHVTHFAGLGAHPAGRNKRNVWTIASQPYSEAHFATMPPKLVEPCILAGSRPGDIVLDPFMGAGTVALVALQHHRDYLGIELNPAYVELARDRIATVQPHLWDCEVSA